MNPILESLYQRRSVRAFQERPVPEELKRAILDAAAQAPSAGCQQLYTILDISDQSLKEALAVSCDEQPFIAKAPVVLVFCADCLKWFDAYVEAGCTPRQPLAGDLMLAVDDAVIAAQNAVVAAQSLGLGSCYIGDIMENYEEHKKLLNLPDYAFPVAMLCMGYYPENYQKRLNPRFKREYVVFKDNYKRLNNDEIKDMFKSLDESYKEKNNYNAKNYAQTHYARKTGAPFAREMARSVREALKVWNGKKG